MSIPRSVDRFQTKVRSSYNQNTVNQGINIPAGIYIGEVTNNVDPDNFGRVKVHIFRMLPTIIPRNTSENITQDDEISLGSVWCQRITPFGGLTDNGGAQSNSFGMMGPPPDVGNTVLVSYTGDFTSGLILGVIPDLTRQQNTTTGRTAVQTAEGVTAGFEPQADGTSEPVTLTAGSARDALQNDTLRGPPRPNPNNIGMTSRDGSAITVSPGDSEDGSGAGIRLATAQGSQIIMDDRTGNIYINNRSGTGWMQLNNNGDFDVYCQGTFSVRAVGGFNFHTDNNFSAQADESINLKSLGGGGVKIQAAGGNIDMDSLNDLKITAQGGELHVNTGGNILLTSRAHIHLNGPTAERATHPVVANQLGNTGITESISGRVPEAEPWRGHLDYSPDSDRSGNPNEYSTAPGAGVDPQRAGNQYSPIAEDASDLVFWADNVDRRIDPSLFSKVESVARDHGRTLRITKGYVEPSRSGGTSAADNSLHMTGKAVDVVYAQGNPEMTRDKLFEIIDLAKAAGIGGIGVYNGGRADAPYANKLHFDLGRERMWGQCDDETLQYDCLPEVVKEHAQEMGYDPDIPAQDSRSGTNRAPANAPDLPPELANDPAFMQSVDQLLADHPEMTREQLYGIMYGESGYDPTLVAQANGLYGGLFQQGGTRQEAARIASLSPAEQVNRYNQYLTSNNYQGGGLGMYQAAPGVVQNYVSSNGTPPPDNVVLYIPNTYGQDYINNLQAQGYDTRYASRQFGEVVLAQNSSGSRTTITPGTGWLDTNGVITVGSVNSYYERN